MKYDIKERGHANYFMFGLQRTATNLIQKLITRNWSKEYCMTAEWNKHDIFSIQPTQGVATYDEVIKWHGYPAIFTYKPLVAWINSALDANKTMCHFRHAEFFMRYVVEPDELFNKEHQYKYAMCTCTSFYQEVAETHCQTTMTNGYQWQYPNGNDERKYMHKRKEYALPLDRFILYWERYYTIWSKVIKELKKANHKIYVVNSMDLLSIKNQARFIKDIYDAKLLNTAIELDTSNIKVVGENEVISETNDFAKKKEEYEQGIWRNLTDEQVKYIKRKTPKTLARLYEKW